MFSCYFVHFRDVHGHLFRYLYPSVFVHVRWIVMKRYFCRIWLLYCVTDLISRGIQNLILSRSLTIAHDRSRFVSPFAQWYQALDEAHKEANSGRLWQNEVSYFAGCNFSIDKTIVLCPSMSVHEPIKVSTSKHVSKINI